MANRVHRRTLLRGIGGTAVALPLLEMMLPKAGALAQAASVPRRYLVMFGGFSLGAAKIATGSLTTTVSEPIDFVPDRTGPGYDIKAALLPISDLGMAGEISVVSGLKIPWAQENGGQIPAGGRPDDYHAMTASALFSGVRSQGGSGESSHARCQGPTSDQIVAQAIAGSTTFRSLQFRAQAIFYTGNGPDNSRDSMSWKLDATNKPVVVPPEPSPKNAFTTLFSDLNQPTDPTAVAKREMLLRARKSILDLVASDTARLVADLGRDDQQRLTQHLDEIRDLERRIDMSPSASMTSSCGPASAPSEAPVNDGLNYSGEEERAASLCDLIKLAFACDRSRVASLMLSTFQSSLNMGPLIGTTSGLHDVGHKLDKAVAAKAVAWHVKHFARLVSLLKSTQDITGTLLDSTAMVFLCEGGIGLDPSAGAASSVHSSDNMACLVAGRAGGLVPGQHIAAKGMHPANVIITAMNAVGVAGGLGEVTGAIPGLRG